MTQEQIKKYEYCKEYLEKLKGFKEKLPFTRQQYGCGSGRPNIEYQLERLHQEMHEELVASINNTINKVQEIVKEI